MLNIDKWIYSIAKADSTLLTLIGGTATDPRIYEVYPPKSLLPLSSTYPAYITYGLAPSGGGYGDVYQIQVPDEIYEFHIFANTKAKMNTVFERIDTLFNKIFNASITGWIVRRIYRTYQGEIHESDDHLYHKVLEYTFEGIWKKVS
ncbi:MAG: hypothetical protein ACFFG0_04640 [Candidatus Thorarchaeota archaeon]